MDTINISNEIENKKTLEDTEKSKVSPNISGMKREHDSLDDFEHLDPEMSPLKDMPPGDFNIKPVVKSDISPSNGISSDLQKTESPSKLLSEIDEELHSFSKSIGSVGQITSDTITATKDFLADLTKESKPQSEQLLPLQDTITIEKPGHYTTHLDSELADFSNDNQQKQPSSNELDVMKFLEAESSKIVKTDKESDLKLFDKEFETKETGFDLPEDKVKNIHEKNLFDISVPKGDKFEDNLHSSVTPIKDDILLKSSKTPEPIEESDPHKFVETLKQEIIDHIDKFEDTKPVSQPEAPKKPEPESIDKLEHEPVTKAEPELPKELVKVPSPEPLKEPSPKPVKEPSPEPVKEPSPLPVKKPSPEPVKEPSPEPMKEPTPEPEIKPEPKHVKEQEPEPAKKLEPEPVIKPLPIPVKETEPKKLEPEPMKEPQTVPEVVNMPEPIIEPESYKPEPVPVKKPVPAVIPAKKEEKTVKIEPTSLDDIIGPEDVFKKIGLDAWFNPDRLHPKVESLVYWRDPKKSGIVFGGIMAILLSLTYFSLISVIAYVSLFTLAATICFRVYKNVLQAVQKTSEGHPFKEFLDMELSLPQDKVREAVESAVVRINACVSELRRLFLVEDLIDSIKFGVLLWCLTYVGAIFNGMTLVIIGFVALFTLPKIYENNKTNIDAYLEIGRSKVAEITSKVKAAVPIGKKEPEKDKEQ